MTELRAALARMEWHARHALQLAEQVQDEHDHERRRVLHGELQQHVRALREQIHTEQDRLLPGPTTYRLVVTAVRRRQGD